MDGFLVVDKGVGKSSHDVVAAVRRLTGQRKAGHTGTLDPFATGVLPVALGEGTKAIPFLDEGVKEYQATLSLGSITDTGDLTGQVVDTAPWQHLSSVDIEAALLSFIGKSLQIPPMYSALKRNGVPLYKLARRGEVVEREARPIEIFAISLLRLAPPEVEFTVRCSRGTYIRSLAVDIGERLGCGAHLLSLRRTQSGPFIIGRAMTLDQLAALSREELLQQLISPCTALDHLPLLPLTLVGAERVARGISPSHDNINAPLPPLETGSLVRLVWQEKLLAVAEFVSTDDAMAKLTLRRVFIN
jgi:tRNA pseudouridine55 synthase